MKVSEVSVELGVVMSWTLWTLAAVTAVLAASWGDQMVLMARASTLLGLGAVASTVRGFFIRQNRIIRGLHNATRDKICACDARGKLGKAGPLGELRSIRSVSAE